MGETDRLIDRIDWDSIGLEAEPEAIPLPTLCNVDELIAVDSFLLVKNDRMDPMFLLWNMRNREQYKQFGSIGNGPGELLRSALPVYGSNHGAFNVLNSNKLRTYKMTGDSLEFEERTINGNEIGLYQCFYALNDTLYCGYRFSPHETGVHLLNINTQKSYDSIFVAKEYNINKRYILNCCAYKDKLVIGRVRFNQIETYHIDADAKKFSPLFTINYKGSSPEKPIEDGACYMNSINADDHYFYMLNQDTEKPGEQTYLDIYTWEGKPVKRLRLNNLFLTGVLLEGKFYLKEYRDDDNLYVLTMADWGIN